MVNFSTSILSSETNGPGGLFDIGATLPLVAIQFLLLMVILNVILYNPLLTIIEERKEYILTNLNTAAELLAKANVMRTEYDEKVNTARKETQSDILNFQKIYKEIFEIEISSSQKYVDNWLEKQVRRFNSQRNIAVQNLEDYIKAVCNQLEEKLKF
jgi:F-type H+-transporting ATPase subunit b